MGEKENAKKFTERIEQLSDQLRTQEYSFRERLDEIIRAKDAEMDRETRQLKQKLKEKEKRLESSKVNSDERLNMALDAKENEIRQLQEHLASTYQN